MFHKRLSVNVFFLGGAAAMGSPQHMHHGLGHMVGATPPPPGHTHSPTSDIGHHWRPPQTCSLEDLPLNPKRF